MSPVRPSWLDPNRPPRLFNQEMHPITNKFPNDPLDPGGKIFGEVQVLDGRVTILGRVDVPRQVDFVITLDNRLVIGTKHATLANNQSVLAAEQMKIDRSGRIPRIDNLSGHYAPTLEESLRIPGLLRGMGLNLTGARFQVSKINFDLELVIDKVWD